MAVNYRNQLERTNLRSKTSNAYQSLHDSRLLYFGAQIPSILLKEHDITRQFLTAQTSAVGVQSIRDLWVLYLVAQGVTYRPSLNDMFKDFFGGAGLP